MIDRSPFIAIALNDRDALLVADERTHATSSTFLLIDDDHRSLHDGTTGGCLTFSLLHAHCKTQSKSSHSPFGE
jgi:hypothetical protein